MQTATPLKPSTLHCACPHCSSDLEIPGEFAGVTAPCPSCGVPLTAPLHDQTPAPNNAPTEQSVNEAEPQSGFSNRINNPQLGVQAPSEQQISNIENAPPLSARPRPPRRKDQPTPQAPTPSQMTNEQLNAYAHPPQQTEPQPQQNQIQQQPFQAAPMPTSPPSPSDSTKPVSRRRSGSSKGAISPTTGLSASHQEKQEGKTVIKIFIAATLCLIVVAAITAALLTRN